MLLLYYLLFLAALILSFYIPGYVFLTYLKLKILDTDRFVLSWFIGISVFLLGTYLLAWINLSHLYFLVIGIAAFLFFKNTKITKKLLPRLDVTTWVLLCVGTFCIALAMFFSGWTTDSGLQFIEVNRIDGVRHTAYTKIMTQFFPPQHPGLAGVELRGFHYFYDFILSRFNLFYKFSVEDLYFRLFPPFLGFLYGAGFYLFGSMMVKDRLRRNLILFFGYFGQSSLLLLFLLNRSVDITNNAIVQPLGLIINPFSTLSVATLLAGFAFLPRIRESWKYGIVVALLLGVLSQEKVYAGLIAIGTLCLYALYLLLSSRFRKSILISMVLVVGITGLLTAVTYLPANYKAGGLVFAPLLYFSHFIQKELYQPLHWEIRRIIFTEHHNWPRIILLYLEAIALFIGVNLGARLLVLYKLPSMLKKSFWQNEYNLILIASISIPVFIGSFFIQSVSPLDSVQFFWLALALFSIPAAVGWADLVERWGGRVKVLLLLILLIMTLPGVIDFEYKYVFGRKEVVSREELSVLNEVTAHVPTGKYILYLPAKKLSVLSTLSDNTPAVSAITGRSVYYEPGGIPGLNTDRYNYRGKQMGALQNALIKCDITQIKKIVSEVGSKYLLSRSPYYCLQDQELLASNVIASRDKNLYFYRIK